MLLSVNSQICTQPLTNTKGGQKPWGPSQIHDSLTGAKWGHRIRAHKTMAVQRNTHNQMGYKQCTSCLCIQQAPGCEPEGDIHHLNIPDLALFFMLLLLTRPSNMTEIRRIRQHWSWSTCKLDGLGKMKAPLGIWYLRKKCAQYEHQPHLYLTVYRIGPWKAASMW